MTDMKNMMHRAIKHMERDPNRSYSMNELRRATGIGLRSQYRLSQQLLASGMVVRDHGAYRFQPYLVASLAEVL